MTRQGRFVAIASSLAAVVVGLASCTASTRVELESADAPAVAPADGADGQNDPAVIAAGAIDTGPAVTTIVATTAGGPTTTTPATTLAPGPTSTVVDGALPDVCATEFARLTAAVDSYVDEYGVAPVSEAELVATAHLRTMSNVYDVWIDGSLRVHGDTCAQPG